MVKVQDIVRHCRICSAVLTGQRRKYCSSLCKNRKKTGLSKVELDWQRRLNSPQYKSCECCHSMYLAKVSGTNKRNGFTPRFCSRKCISDFAAKVRLEREAIRRIKAKNTPAPVVDVAKPVPKPPKVFSCLACGSTRTSCDNARWLKYCSDKCRPAIVRSKPNKQSEAYKRHKKIWRLKRKALERGACRADKFHPFDVFNRDGWKCQICGVSTPQKLRGSQKHNAPEIDHIQPLSRGGEHTMQNCQTSCRTCNMQKSNGRPVGQIGLFTSLMGYGGPIQRPDPF